MRISDPLKLGLMGASAPLPPSFKAQLAAGVWEMSPRSLLKRRRGPERATEIEPSFLMEFNKINDNLKCQKLNFYCFFLLFVCLFYQERMMPGVIMATECKAFDKLYQLTDLEEPTITVRVQRLLMLLPTDPDVQEALESISQQVTKL